MSVARNTGSRGFSLLASAAKRPSRSVATSSNGNNSNKRHTHPLTLPPSSRSYSSTPPAQASGARSGLVTALLVGIVGAGAYVAGSLYPPKLLALIKPRDLPPAPEVATPEGIAWTANIERQLQSLPLVQELLSRGGGSTHIPHHDEKQVGSAPGANPNTRASSLETGPTAATATAAQPHYIASRPYRKFAPEKLLHSLTAGTLRGPGKFAVPPLVIAKTSAGVAAEGSGAEGDAYAFIHLGRSLCGHNGIIHGGLLATICDEALARTAFFHLPSNVGVTAKLELDYKAPTHADQFVVIKTELVEAKGRKAVVKGSILDMAGNTLVNARAIFVEPKFAKFLDASLVKDAMDR